MKADNHATRISPRALRLKTEAGNCLTIAVRQEDPAFAADLIDEAIRLTRRARELGDRTGPSPAAKSGKMPDFGRKDGPKSAA